uniref:Uncharacterized protein n=1 Tax=Oryza glumipatula TaxID=40148 RepID=A0A0D9ZDA7_9ORYZ
MATPTATPPPPEPPPTTEELRHLHRHDGHEELSQRMSGASFRSASSSGTTGGRRGRGKGGDGFLVAVCLPRMQAGQSWTGSLPPPLPNSLASSPSPSCLHLPQRLPSRRCVWLGWERPQ